MRLREYRREAREVLDGKWGIAVGVTAIYFAISFALGIWGELKDLAESFSPFTVITVGSNIITFFVTGAIVLGSVNFFLRLARRQDLRISHFFAYFTRFERYLQSLIYLIVTGILLLLWFLLLIIPGIIKSYSYAMTPYILNDEPELSILEAITKSRRMMDGYKWKLFLLHLSFIGWFILALISFGIGFLWLNPYFQTTESRFYMHRKEQSGERDDLTRQKITPPVVEVTRSEIVDVKVENTDNKENKE